VLREGVEKGLPVRTGNILARLNLGREESLRSLLAEAE
jgi:hypothetical protein